MKLSNRNLINFVMVKAIYYSNNDRYIFTNISSKSNKAFITKLQSLTCQRINFYFNHIMPINSSFKYYF